MNQAMTQYGGERGSVAALVLIYTLIALTAAFIVASATDAYLARKRAFTVADAAALAGAKTSELSDISAAEGSPAVQLDPVRAEAAVRAHVAALPGEYRVDTVAVTDGDAVTVRISCDWSVPFTAGILAPHHTISVESTSRATLERADVG